MMASKSLGKVLTSPSKVAHALDWRKVSGSILSLSISRDRIDLAVASHPEADEPVQPLPSIPLKTETVVNDDKNNNNNNGKSSKKALSSRTVEELANIVKDWRVCGFVVSWPVQEEGWCGAPCGKVLHTLDQINAQSNVLNKNRPLCLWDVEHHEAPEDEWGRAAVYSVPTDKTVHKASVEQYEAPNTVVADIWNDFCRAHWPEFQERETVPGTSSSLASGKRPVQPQQMMVDPAWLDGAYEDTSAFVKATAM